jgi:hypothetical protein
MPALEEIFEGLTTAQLLAFVDEHRIEDLTLDFKLAPKNFDTPDERKVLAKAISGFANSSGGLIVWGIEAKRGPEDIDCAQQAVPLTQPEMFMSRLWTYSGSAVSPVVDGLRHRLVEGLGGPFALTIVPESLVGPHMAKLGEDRYFKRSGDSFVKMEHFDVADMFGRRRRPQLSLVLHKEGPGSTILVSVRNDGRGIAKAPYQALDLPKGFRTSGYGFDGNGSFGLRPIGRSYVRCFFGGDATSVIHVGQELIVTKLEATTTTVDGKPAIKGPQVFRYDLAAEELRCHREKSLWTIERPSA